MAKLPVKVRGRNCIVPGMNGGYIVQQIPLSSYKGYYVVVRMALSTDSATAARSFDARKSDVALRQTPADKPRHVQCSSFCVPRTKMPTLRPISLPTDGAPHKYQACSTTITKDGADSGIPLNNPAVRVNTYKRRPPPYPHATTSGDNLKTLSPAPPRQCALCPYTSSHSGHMLNHMRIHTGEKPFKCKWCSFESAHASSLKNHTMTKHTGEKPHKCTSCAYASAHISNLKKHMMIHTGEKPFKCTLCPFQSVQASTMKIHIMTIHTGEKPFKCTSCSYASAQASAMKSHIMAIHTGEKPYKCKSCSYASSRSGALRNHMRRHTGEKPFKCPLCSYASAHVSNLKKHIRTHTGEKPFKCTSCTYACASAGGLKSHMNIHTGDKPFKCKSCSYASAHASTMKRHGRIHSGEKPFKCTSCSYTSAYCFNLRNHARIHGKDKNFKSARCSCAIARMSAFQRRHSGIHREKKLKLSPCMYGTKMATNLTRPIFNHKTTRFADLARDIKLVTRGKVYKYRAATSKSHTPGHVPPQEETSLPRQHNHEYVCVLCSFTAALYSQWIDHVFNVHGNDHITYGNSPGKQPEVVQSLQQPYNSHGTDAATAWTIPELLREMGRRPSIYQCHCGMVFLTFSLYNAHVCCHGDEDVLRCEDYGFLASDRKSFMAHFFENNK